MNEFKVGDKVKLNRDFAGISKGTIFWVVPTNIDNRWLHIESSSVNIHFLNQFYKASFDLVEEEEITVKTLPSWMKEIYYNHYIEIVTDFIKGYANDHHISVVESEGKDTVLTATPIKKGN